MKYIDAEKLKEEIESINLIPQTSADYNDGREDMKMMVLDIIDSLQQEQSQGLHFTPLNRLIQKIPSENWNDTVNNYAKKLCDCLINEGFQKDAEVLQGYISYMNGNNVPMATMDEQEQPEVDVEKEIDLFVNGWNIDDLLGLVNDEGWSVTVGDIKNVARHFYELGRLNARKEK